MKALLDYISTQLWPICRPMGRVCTSVILFLRWQRPRNYQVKMWECCSQVSRMDILILQSVPHLSRLSWVLQAHGWNASYCTGGALTWEDSAGAPTANRNTLNCCILLALACKCGHVYILSVVIVVNISMCVWYVLVCMCVCIICVHVFVCACACVVWVFCVWFVSLDTYIANHQGHHRGIPCY